MTNGRVVAAIVLAVVVVVTAQQDADHGHHYFRRIVHECKSKFSPFSVKNHSEPIWAAKKTVSGLYDPRSHHAFRKTVVTVAKLEDAVIRDPKEAEKCMVNCIAEKLRWINHTTQQINSSRVFEGLLRFARHFNEVSVHKQIDTSKLKRLVSKCIDGTAGYYDDECEKGFKLMRCVHTAIVESIYEVPSAPMSTTVPSTSTSWNDNSAEESRPERIEENESFRPRPYPHPRPLYLRRPNHLHRFGGPPPPPQGMMPPPPPPPMGFGMPMQAAVPMAGAPEPAMIAYGQHSGVIEVFGRRPRFGQPWRDMPVYKKK